MIVEYVPQAAKHSVTTLASESVKDSWLIDGLMYFGKVVLTFISTSAMSLEPIFVVVAICGFFLIMAGFDKIGYKLTSGSIVGFIACKVCGSLC